MADLPGGGPVRIFRQCGSCGVCRIYPAESDPAGGYGAGADPGVAETGGQAFRQPQN